MKGEAILDDIAPAASTLHLHAAKDAMSVMSDEIKSV